jgi:hypothetical protein
MPHENTLTAEGVSDLTKYFCIVIKCYMAKTHYADEAGKIVLLPSDMVNLYGDKETGFIARGN